jgi:glycine/D-amino acid oxidase-like deaminating enzyme
MGALVAIVGLRGRPIAAATHGSAHLAILVHRSMERSGPQNGGVSFWYADTSIPSRRAPLDGDRNADVCIVGGGFTGLWTAYYLKQAAPELEIVVLEREFAGFGASGRNGGWLSDHFMVPRSAVARRNGREGVTALLRAMREAVDEVIEVCEREGIDADIVKHGLLQVARSPAQAARLRQSLADDRGWGIGPEDTVEVDAQALAERVRVADATLATWDRHAARVQPAKLVQGLAAAVERLGVTIYESTPVREIEPGAARSARGTVRARHVISCLEGFTADLRGQRRTWLPLNSAIIVTAPLPDGVREQIGWAGEELLGDSAHAYMYAQITADGRIALGGRGIPYRYGSRTDHDGQTQKWTIDQLAATLRGMFPAAATVPIDHAWCGVLGVPRDWWPMVRLDRATGLGIAGGYVGSGVATTNLAGRTLRDLILDQQTELTRLPWVGHSARKWEPEPFRWLGARLIYTLYRYADRRETETGSERTHPAAQLADLISGR